MTQDKHSHGTLRAKGKGEDQETPGKWKQRWQKHGTDGKLETQAQNCPVDRSNY